MNLQTKTSLFENAPAIIAFHDLRHHILWANDAYCKATGLSLEEIMGRKCYSAWGLSGMCRSCPVTTAMETGEPAEAELTPQNQDHWPDSQSSWFSKAMPLRDKDSTIIGVIEVAYNITEYKREKRGLGESERRFRSLVEVTSDWVWEVDRNGFYTYTSHKITEILGYEPEELIGKRPFDLMPRDEANSVAAFFRNVVQSGKPFHRLENTNLHKDGHPVVLETSGVPLFDEEGNLVGYRGIDRDITERKRLEQAFNEVVSEERERLWRDLHDSISQQLTGLRLLAVSLSRDLSEIHPEAANRAAHIEQTAKDALLSVRQIARGLEPLSQEPDALVTALQELALRVNDLYGVPCRFTSRKTVLVHNPDTASHLFLIAQEAVANAVRHAQASRIAISLSERNSTLRLVVRDDGVGFSHKKQSMGMGIHIMQTRARLIGASFGIQTGKAGGTAVTCSWKRALSKG